MREILLVVGVVVAAVVAGTAATHAVRGFWIGANGAPLSVRPTDQLDVSPPVTGWNTSTGTPIVTP